MSNVNKAVLGTIVSASAIGAMGVSANADEVVVSEEPILSATPATNLTRKNVKDAESNLNQATKDKNIAEKNVQDANQKATQAEHELEKAKEIKDEASPEKIAETEKKIEDAKQTAPGLNNKEKELNQTLVEKQQELNKAKEAEKQAQKKVTDQQNKINVDDKAVIDKQNQINNTNQTQADKDLDAAKKAEKQAEVNKSKSEDAMKNAQGNKTSAEEKKKAADKTVTDKKANLTTKQNNANKAKEAKTKTTQKVKGAQSKHENAKKNMNGVIKIELPTGFDKALIDSIGMSQTSGKTREILAKGYAANHGKFRNLKSPATEVKINVNNMTAQQKAELTEFAASLLNPIRKAFGNVLLQSSNSVSLFTDAIIKQYNDRQWSIFEEAGHFDDGIKAEAGKVGLSDGGNYYENLSAGYLRSIQEITMSDLKNGIYESIISMIFDDERSYNGHMQSLLGNMDKYSTKTGFAVAVDSMGQIHFIQVGDNNIDDENKFQSNLVDFPETDGASLLQALEQAEAELKEAQAEDAAMTQSLENADVELKAAQTELNAAEENAKTTNDALAKATQLLGQAEAEAKKAVDELDDAKNHATQAENTAKNIEARLLELKAELDKLKTAAADSKAELVTLETAHKAAVAVTASAAKDVAKAQMDVNAAKDNISELEGTIAKLTKYLESLKNADKQLAAAEASVSATKKALADAEKELLAAKIAHDVALNALKEAREKAGTSSENGQEVSEKWTVAPLNNKTKQDTNAILLSSQGGEINSTSDAKHALVVKTELPNTSSSTQTHVSIIGVLFAGLTLWGFGYKKRG